MKIFIRHIVMLADVNIFITNITIVTNFPSSLFLSVLNSYTSLSSPQVQMTPGKVCADDGAVFDSPIEIAESHSFVADSASASRSAVRQSQHLSPSNCDPLTTTEQRSDTGAVKKRLLFRDHNESPIVSLTDRCEASPDNRDASYPLNQSDVVRVDNDAAATNGRVKTKARTYSQYLDDQIENTSDSDSNVCIGNGGLAPNTQSFPTRSVNAVDRTTPPCEGGAVQRIGVVKGINAQDSSINSAVTPPVTTGEGVDPLNVASKSSLYTTDEDDIPFSQEYPEVRESEMLIDDSSEDSYDSEAVDDVMESREFGERFTPAAESFDFIQNVIEDMESGLFAEPLDEFLEVDDPFTVENGNEPIDNDDGNTVPMGGDTDNFRGVQGNVGLPNWTYGSPHVPVKVSVNDVDRALERRFVDEVSGILQNVEQEILSNRAAVERNGETQGISSFTRLDIFDVFLPQSFLEKLRKSVNTVLRSRNQPPLVLEGLRGIIILHVLCASYRESPTTVCSTEEKNCFLDMGISAERYKEVWSALSCTTSRRKRVEHTAGGWTYRPTKGNALVAEIEQDVAAINRQLLYVANATVLALDDDHVRLSSRSVSTMTNLRQINNPQKALGPVMNALCSALTSCYITGHYTRNGEQLIDVWVRVVELLQGATSKNALTPMTDAVFAADRGYNHAASIDFMTDVLGASALGTHKRSLDFPFMFGESSLRHKHKGYHISEKGCRALYSAKQKRGASSRGRHVEASVYRESYTGRIAAFYHNNERMFGSNKFTLVPRDRFRGVVDSDKINAIQTCFECKVCAVVPAPGRNPVMLP